MTTHPHFAFDPLLEDADAAKMVRICEQYGAFKMYSEEPTFAGMIGEGLPARWDAARNFVKTGGRFGRSEPLHVLAARTNYFRETYAYGRDERVEGIGPYLHHEGFIEAARKLFGKPIIEPAIVYANLLVPGQELAIHTDVPEFRGVNRKNHPQWLIVVMHHSGLFEKWRMPIATGVAWFHDCAGGEFAFYPEGATGKPIAHPVRYNTALLMDTDTVFHGVDRVAETAAPVDKLRPGMKLSYGGDGRWYMAEGDERVAEYRWNELRYSISWKAYCFADAAEQRAWQERIDDLSVTDVVDRLVEDLRARDVIRGERPSDTVLVDLLIDSYVHYPQPAAA
jgi:hypothetical protein